MGQYHQIYNLTKKETFSPHALNDGAKLLEWGCGGAYTAGLAVLLCNSNGRGGGDLTVPGGEYDYEKCTMVFKPGEMAMRVAIAKIEGRWAGDKIVVQGDYAEKGDPAFISDKRLAGFTDISDKVIDALRCDEYLKKLMGQKINRE